VGGGAIGLASAWRAAQAGMRVVLLERGRLASGASHVAAGMLAPSGEADPGERPLLALGLVSAQRWPQFAEELARAGGIDPGHRRCGTLRVGGRSRRGRGARARGGGPARARDRLHVAARGRRTRARAGAGAFDSHGAGAARRPCSRPAPRLRRARRGRARVGCLAARGCRGSACALRRRTRDRRRARRRLAAGSRARGPSPPAAGRAARRCCRMAPAFPCAPSRARSCDSAIRPGPGCCPA